MHTHVEILHGEWLEACRETLIKIRILHVCYSSDVEQHGVVLYLKSFKLDLIIFVALLKLRDTMRHKSGCKRTMIVQSLEA